MCGIVSERLKMGYDAVPDRTDNSTRGVDWVTHRKLRNALIAAGKSAGSKRRRSGTVRLSALTVALFLNDKSCQARVRLP